MDDDHDDERTRPSTRTSTGSCSSGAQSIERAVRPGRGGLQAALAYLEGRFDSPESAGAQFGVQRQNVNYYVRQLMKNGMTRTPSPATQPPAPVEEPIAVDDPYAEAYVYAGQLCATMGKRAAARIASERYGVAISANTARRAQESGGPPRKRGRELYLGREVEQKLEDLCLALRSMKLPVFRFMVLSYVNVLVKDTEIAEKLKDKEVKRHWYYNWLSRCKRLKTANLTPLEMARAKWATPANIKKHYDMLAEMMVELKIAVHNPAFDPEKPYSQRLIILKPERILSMDETRLTNDSREKNKSNANRSLVGVNDTREALANKGGGDGTAIGGSSADGKDLPAFFVFANNILHRGDVVGENHPVCRRPDPADPSRPMPCRFWTNEKGGVTGDLGVRYITGCIEPCLPDLSKENPALLIMDGHGSHFTLELLLYCRSKGLHVVLRPPHTTHILQGEDVVHFSVFKSKYHQAKMLAIGKKALNGSYKLSSADLLKVCKEPWEEAFNFRHCINAWEEIGVVPFTQRVYWELLEREAAAAKVACTNNINPEMLTVQGMVSIMYGRSERTHEELAGTRRDRDTLHSCDLWDLPGGATGDEVVRRVQAKSDAKLAKAHAAEAKKKARADAKQRHKSASLQLGAQLATALVHDAQIQKLKVDEIKALLSFFALNVPIGSKKPELIALLSAHMQLPKDGAPPALVRVAAAGPSTSSAILEPSNVVLSSSDASSSASEDFMGNEDD